jgi:hypothetical protein
MQYIKSRNLFNKNSTLDGYEITNEAAGIISESKDWFVTDYIPVSSNTYYVVSGKPSGRVVLFYDNQKQLISSGNGGSGSGYGIFYVSNASFVRLNGKLTDKDTFQLQRGQVATPYEPYMLPFKILKRTKNLIDIDAMVRTNPNGTSDDALVKNADGSYTITKNGTNRFGKTISCNIPAGKYTYSGILINKTDGVKGIGVQWLDKDNKAVLNNTWYFNYDKVTIEFSRDVASVRFYIDNSYAEKSFVTFKNLMLNEGTEKLTYEPYIQQCDIQCPINLIDCDEMLANGGYIDTECLTKNEDGSYTITKLSKSARFSRCDYTNIKAGKYRLSYDIIEKNDDYYYPFQFDYTYTDGSGSTYGMPKNYNAIIWTITKPIEKIRLYLDGNQAIGTYVKFKNLKLIRIGD